MQADVPTPALSARSLRIVVVTSTYHAEITDALERGAIKAFEEASGDRSRLRLVKAPGAFELVAISRAAAVRGDVDAVVAIGCVLTGETSHDRHICDAVANGLARISVEFGKPAAFGVLTCQTLGQAQARAGGAKGNKGEEAMRAAIGAANAVKELQ
ncbi:MAG: 6,7-dimethyl-8-ribityllumazine synthase [Phycisphaerales bacterium]